MKIFGFRLTYLYKKNLLFPSLHFMKKFINAEKFIGHGDDASCFHFGNNQVIKLCTKDIGYFRKFNEKKNLLLLSKEPLYFNQLTKIIGIRTTGYSASYEIVRRF